ncbi:MAG: type III-B CRISPR module-associated protein Cmr5 [Anaerolineales bacterium]|nr:type III-B CRISPR module-associated protein Cmr5 [Anaerolineales bacterium]
MRTLEQKYAAIIYTQVDQYRTDHPDEADKDRKRYGSMAHKLPILVRIAGLAQALAFVESRGKEPYQKLLSHLASVVIDGNKDDLLKQSREADLQQYTYLTRKTMLALTWYKRFAQSVLKIEATDDDEEDEDDHSSKPS